MIRVFVLDDYEVVRLGLVDLVESDDDMRVVGQARTAKEALARVPLLGVDVAVLDVRLPDGSGVEVCRELRSRRPGLACLMLTSFADDDALRAAVAAGAAGFVLKGVCGPDLLRAIRTVASGASLLDEEAVRGVMQRPGRAQRQDQRLALLGWRSGR